MPKILLLISAIICASTAMAQDKSYNFTNKTGTKYNLKGQKVDSSYKGIIISDGKRF